MKTLLVIGGSGFFGKSILDAYVRGLLNPWNVSNLILMARRADRLVEEVPHLIVDGVELLSADITTTKTIPRADYVIHAAASTDIRDYLSKPEQEKRNIHTGTLNFCELAEKFLKDSKITYVSSGAVYGVQPPDIENITEDFSFGNVEEVSSGKMDYAIAKRDAENAIQSLANKGYSVSIARCFAFVGPWLPRDQHFAIGNFLEDILKKRPIVVKAKHNVFRSFMYSDDLVEWLMAIAESSNQTCPIYNVGSDEAVLLGDLAKMLSKQFGVGSKIATIVDKRVDRYVPAVGKVRRDLGVSLKYDLSAAVDKTISEISKL